MTKIVNFDMQMQHSQSAKNAVDGVGNAINLPNLESLRLVTYQIGSSLSFLDYVIYSSVTQETVNNLKIAQSNCVYYKNIKNILSQGNETHSVALKREREIIECFLFNELLFTTTKKLIVPCCITDKLIKICHRYYNRNNTEHLSKEDIMTQLQKLHIDNVEQRIINIINTCGCIKQSTENDNNAQISSDPLV